jgi:heme/copper-type cytochrome/quinol oxidase subunit 3
MDVVTGFITSNSMVSYLYIYRYTPMDNPFYWYLTTRDILRETSRDCYSITHGIYIYYLLVFILSESILFTSVFWVLLHIILSTYSSIYESILIPEPCELTYGTTLLLSNAGISIGTVYTSRDSTGVLHWNVTTSLVWSLLFLVLQVSEFSVLGVYTNDSYTGTVYICISGLHLIHILVGITIVGVSSGTGYSIDIIPVDTTSMDIYSTLDYSYYHLIELVYIYIYLILYYYYYGLYTCTIPTSYHILSISTSSVYY